MHQVQITKVNRPMETVKRVIPTGISERGQKEKAHGSWAQPCNALDKFQLVHSFCALQKGIYSKGNCNLALASITNALVIVFPLSFSFSFF